MTVTYAALFAKIADSLSNTHGRITALRTFVTVQFRPPVSENVKAFSAFLLTDGAVNSILGVNPARRTAH